jgi:hypothetical protein
MGTSCYRQRNMTARRVSDQLLYLLRDPNEEAGENLADFVAILRVVLTGFLGGKIRSVLVSVQHPRVGRCR